MPSLIQRILELNHHVSGRHYFRLHINGHPVGHVDQQFVASLPREIFTIDTINQSIRLDFLPENRTVIEQAIHDFFRDYFTGQNCLHIWRDEQYAVREHASDAPILLIERSALSFLGITGYGVHVNGYIERDDGLYMWIAKRAASKATAPGKLDQIAAGGLPHNISVFENLIKECEEEASIPRELASQSVSVSALSYWYDLPIGVRPDVILNYDLKLPVDFVPQVNDCEVESFMLLPIDTILQRLASTQDFKFNSAVVIIDFALRHGVLSPDNYPNYVALQNALHGVRHA